MEIAGEIVKNFPGSLTATDKTRMAEQVFGIGLRSLSYLLKLAEENQEGILRLMYEVIRFNDTKVTKVDATNKAVESLIKLIYGAAHGVVKRMAFALGTPDLLATHQQILKNSDSAAKRLTVSTILIDHSIEFPTDFIGEANGRFKANGLASAILNHFVVQHLRIVPMKTSMKQMICAKLGIPFGSLELANLQTRMLELNPGKTDSN